ncbi:MAG TPA: carboxylesterase/lipase family protein, partial [Amycolatopsis sp.]
LLLGTNTEEGNLYLVPQGKLGSSAALGNTLFGAGTARLAQAHARISGGRTHLYSFGYRSTALDGRLGAAHTVELPFVFDLAEKPWLHGETGLLGPDPVPPGLAARMHAAWIAFARTGDPGWPAYDPERPVAEVFGASPNQVRRTGSAPGA